MSSDYDDLPPKKEVPADEESASGSLGELFGAAVWIVPIILLGGLIGWIVIQALHR
ncbi:MAG TPA: hypothetical protein VGG10_14610 [Rhizomicrobium sp.]|jgi:hypothetical protein